MIARKAIGLEGSILDHDLMEVGALDGTDFRRFTVRVAGPAALIVAKVYKLRDRLAEGKLTASPTRMPPTCIGSCSPSRFASFCAGYDRSWTMRPQAQSVARPSSWW